MGLYKLLVDAALPLARAKRTKRVVVGLNYTLAEVERLGPGLAYTLLDKGNCCELSHEISFWRRPADILIKGYLSGNPVERSVALAVMNAIFNNRKEVKKQATQEDIFAKLPIDSSSEVVMIGEIRPIVAKLEGRVKKVWIFDGEWEELKYSFGEVAKKASVAVITSSTLVNQTLEEIFEFVKDVPEVLLVGPSTPLKPEVFRFTPVTWLCGAISESSELLFQLVCEGKGAPAFFKQKALKKIALRVPK